MNIRKMIKTICENCAIEFEKPDSEVKRNLKLNRPNFCSRKCVGINNIKNLENIRRVTAHLIDYQSDEYTGFRTFIVRANARHKYEVNITKEYLKEVWDNQNGRCVYTNIQLKLPSHKKMSNDKIYTASLDRIDSSKGYIEGNVQFVSMSINFMKNSMTHGETLQLINLIKN